MEYFKKKILLFLNLIDELLKSIMDPNRRDLFENKPQKFDEMHKNLFILVEIYVNRRDRTTYDKNTKDDTNRKKV